MKKYALLVGIDDYKSEDINDLGGCKNDVENMQKHTKDFDTLPLTNEDATRKAIIDNFRTHLGKATKGDLALFYFSGHGSREVSPSEFEPYQQDKRHETIVCHDSDTSIDNKQVYDIADKEMKLLINELAIKGAEVVVIYDCCHSGSGTRDFEFSGIREVIRNKATSKERAKEDYLKGTFDILATKPKHLFMAACGLKEKAIEKSFNDEKKGDRLQGVFTNALLAGLAEEANISYTNLSHFCKHYIQVISPDVTQTPKLEVTGPFDAEASFLTTDQYPIRAAAKIIQSDVKEQWRLALGAAHGLLLDKNKRPQFRVYKDKELTNQVCIATASEIRLAESILGELKTGTIDDSMPSLDKDEIYYVIPSYLPLNKLAIYVSGISNKKDLTDKIESSKLEEVNYALNFFVEDSSSLYEVAVEEDGYWLLYKETQTPIIPIKIKQQILIGENETIEGLPILIELLLRIAQWERLKKLSIEKSSIFAREQKRVDLFFSTDIQEEEIEEEWKPVDDAVTLDFNPELKPAIYGNKNLADRLHKISFQLEIANNSNTSLYCYPYYLSRKYSACLCKNIDAIPSNGSPKIIDETTLFIPVHKEPHLNQVTDEHTILISKKELPFLNLELQKSLLEYYTSFLVQLRDSDRRKDRATIERKQTKQWFTKKLTIKTLKILGDIGNLPLSIANNQITFNQHTNFTAQVGLASSAAYMRGPLSDQIIKQKLEALGFELVDFSSFQIAEIENKQFKNKETVLELHHINNAESLQNDPLTINLQLEELSKGDKLLALTLPPSLDGQKRKALPGTFPILGYLEDQSNGQFNIALKHIPANPDDGRRESGKSFKISFVKVSTTRQDEMNQWIVTDTEGQDWLKLD